MFAKYVYRRAGNLTQTRFQSPLLLEKIPQTGAKALLALPLKFKFIFDACPLSSPAFSFSNHILDRALSKIFGANSWTKRVGE